MSVTKERFDQGMTYDQYKAQMTQRRDQLEAAEAAFSPSSVDLAAFAGLPAPVNVVAIGEDWCGDVIADRDNVDGSRQAGECREIN